MGPIDDTGMIREAWAHATSLSADGQLQQAVMEFLRIREILRDQNRKLQSLDALPVGGDGLPAPAFGGTGASQAEALPTKARKGAAAVVDKLLSKVDEEIRSHLQFLQGNPYAALQLPLSRGGAGGTTSIASCEVTDALVKNNYRRLALRFHPDKTGGADSSHLFAAIRAAYETLATSRDRGLYKAVPAGNGGAAFCWAVDVRAASTRGSTGRGGVAGIASSQGSARPAGEECPIRLAPRKEKDKHSGGSGSNDAFFRQNGCCRENSTAGFQEGLGASRQGGREAGGHETQLREEPGSDDNNGHSQPKKACAQDCVRVEIGGQGDGRDVEGHAGRQVKGNTKISSAAPNRTKGHGKKQHPAEEHVVENQSGEGTMEDAAVGLKVGHQAKVGSERSSKALGPSASSPAPSAGDGGAQKPNSPFTGRRNRRKQPDDRSVEESGGVDAHRFSRTPVPVRTGSPLPPPSQPAVKRTASGGRSSTRPPEELVVSGTEAVGKPSAASTSDSFGERKEREGERSADSCSFHGPFRDHALDARSLSDDASRSGVSEGGGGGGGCVQRLRERVTTTGRGQYHNATACASPMHAYELQKEVDFWVSGARREGVSLKHASVDGGIVYTAVAEDDTAISADSSSEPRLETLPSPHQRRRRRVFVPESGGDAVDRLVQAATSVDEGRKGDLLDRKSADEQSAPAGRAPHSFERIEISSTTVAAGAGRGWFWGAAT